MAVVVAVVVVAEIPTTLLHPLLPLHLLEGVVGEVGLARPERVARTCSFETLAMGETKSTIRPMTMSQV